MKQFVNKSIELGNWGLSIFWNLVLGIWDLTNKGVKMGKIFFSLPRPQWERAGVRVILGCLWLITGLCFGQEGLLKTEAKPSLMYGNGFHNQPLTVLKNSQLQPLSFYASYKRPLFNSFITNALIMQAENETLQPKKSFWKQAGIYGLEFVGAAMGSVVSICYGDLSAGSWWGSSDYSLIRGFVVYSITNTLFTSSCTWGLGKLLGQKGTWWKSAVGSGIGALTGFTSAYLSRKKGEFTEVGIVFLLTTPTIGAVIGYNKK